jgi:hypothetical protein
LKNFELFLPNVLSSIPRPVIIALQRGKQIRQNSRRQITMEKEMKFGVEIEFFGVAQELVASRLRSAGVECFVEGYNHNTRNHWKVVTDCSVTSQGTGASRGNELVSPILYGQEGLREVEAVCDVLNELGAKVDRSCGVHVHHDVRGLTVKQLQNIAKIYIKYQQVFDALVPASRRNNTYCKHISMHNETTKLNAEINEYELRLWDRYQVVNYETKSKPTVEFRQHSGSTDGEKITNWIILTHKVIEKAMDAKNIKKVEGTTTLTDVNRMYQRMKRDLGIDEQLGKYLLNRMKKLREQQGARRAA